MNEHASTSSSNTFSFLIKIWTSCHTYRHQQLKQQYQQVNCEIQQESLLSNCTDKTRWWTAHVTKLSWYHLLYNSQELQIKISHKNTAWHHAQKKVEVADIYQEIHVFITDWSIFK